MKLLWATESLVIDGRPHPGFPILLWNTPASCVPANEFMRHFLSRGAVYSRFRLAAKVPVYDARPCFNAEFNRRKIRLESAQRKPRPEWNHARDGQERPCFHNPHLLCQWHVRKKL